MKKIIFLLSIFFLMEMGLYAQEMKLPPAVDNAFLKACEGEWISDEYELMGMLWRNETKAEWILNNQFIETKTTINGQGGLTFKSYSIMTADKGGYFKQWSFDEWGEKYSGFFEGKTEGTKLSLKGGTINSNGSGEIIIDGNVMTQNLTFIEQNPEGKIDTTSLKIIFRKQ